ncbi:MAG: hypothetical protein LBI20_01035 [Holosporales bacterium]|nr:hypothetical protein [Holosporales bacterium]
MIDISGYTNSSTIILIAGMLAIAALVLTRIVNCFVKGERSATPRYECGIRSVERPSPLVFHSEQWVGMAALLVIETGVLTLLILISGSERPTTWEARTLIFCILTLIWQLREILDSKKIQHYNNWIF